MAREISRLSPDEETKVGALMLSSDGRIIATSYNGFVRGAEDDKLPKKRPDKHKFIQHAERNMIYNCSYLGISTKDSTIICTLSPCLDCLRACYASGVKTIFFEELYQSFDNVDFYTNLEDVTVKVNSVGLYTELNMSHIKDSYAE